jgi:hypothetical protein
MGYSKAFDDDSKYEEAEFNLAVGTVIRINEKLKEVNFYLQIGDYPNAFKAEQVVFSEIYPFIKKDKGDLAEKEKKREKEIETEINSNYTVRKNKTRLFIPTIKIDHELRKWDRELRCYLLKYKLYMKMQDTRLAAAKV